MSTGTYRGNPLLKRSNTKQDWTQEQIQEYKKCFKDPIYFIENYVKIVHVDKGLVPFTLYPYQHEIISSLHENRYTILATGRQVGKSITTGAYILWYIIFNSRKTVAILANKASTAREILDRIQAAYMNLPKWLQHGVETFNKGTFKLENGSQVLAASSSSSAIRGFSINFLMIDECVIGDTVLKIKDTETGQVKDTTIEFLYEYMYEEGNLDIDKYKILTGNGYKSFRGIDRHRADGLLKLIFDSTSSLTCTYGHLIQMKNGKFKRADTLKKGDVTSTNKTVSFIEDCSDDNRYVYDLLSVEDTASYLTNSVISHNCAFVPNFSEFFASVFPTISSGKTTKAVLVSTPNGLNHFYKIYNEAINGDNDYNPITVTWDKVPGRDEKWKQETIRANGNDMEKFGQEHCVEFLGSSGTLISGWKLKELTHQPPTHEDKALKVYEQPKDNNLYMIVADVSRGKGLDYSAFSVFDISGMPYTQVATYRSNIISPTDYANYINNIGRYFNYAQILVEVNDIGAQVADLLFYDYGYEYLLKTQSKGRNGKTIVNWAPPGKSDRGVRTTASVKRTGCSILKLLIEQNQLIVNDFETIQELSVFSQKGNSYEAEQGKHDDMVMGLVLFAWASTQSYFRDMTDTNTLHALREQTQQEVEDYLLPFGIVDNGIEVIGNSSDVEWL